MEDAQSDADKIRMKRLAKLGGQSSPTPDQSTSQKPEASSTMPHTQSSPQPSQGPAVTSSSEGNVGLTSNPQIPPVANPTPAVSGPKAKININPGPLPKISSASAPNTTKKPNNAPKPGAGSGSSGEVSLEVWTDRTISSVFRVVVDPASRRDPQNRGFYFAEGVKSDLEEEGAPLKLTVAVLDQAILEAATNSTGEPLDYLLGCWKRVTRLFRSPQKGDPSKQEVVKEARRLCMSYCIFAVTMPDMFGRDVPETSPLVPYLLKQSDSDRGICQEFLAEAVSRFHEDETIKEALVGGMEDLSASLAKLSLNSDYQPYITALRNYCRFQPLVVAMTQSPKFIPPNLKAPQIELYTLLGPFFRLSPLQADVALNYFSNAGSGDNKSYIANSQNALRMTLRTLQNELFDISHSFVVVKEARERMLDWFALTVNLNHKRRAIQYKPDEVSSDGFVINVTTILDKLCEPFMDATFSKIDRIDVNYLRRNPRVSMQDETKLNADQQTSDDFYAITLEGTNNFISEIFFLTLASHHYGTESANNRLEGLYREVKYLEKHIKKFELERHKFANNPRQLQHFETLLKKYKDQLEKGQCTIHATEGVLLDKENQERSVLLMRYLIVFLLRIVCPDLKDPKEKPELPLPEEQPLVFRCLPEYFVEDIVDNFKFITRTMPHNLSSVQCEELVTISIVFLRSTDYIKNPYLKSGLVTILSFGVWGFPGRSKGVLGELLYGSDFCNKHLLHSLISFFIEAETTGGHNQFWDKFNIRSEIFRVIKCIWPNPVYRENLAAEAKTNLDFFVRFVNLLMNDSTFVLDECFTAITKINELQKLLRGEGDEDLDAEQRQEKEEALGEQKSRAKSYMSITKESMAMLKLFTETLPETFTTPEVVQRLADMLDYNLDALVSKKQSNLKLEDPKETGWDPGFVLSELVDVYLNLSQQPRFHTAIARDGRSYRAENFGKASYILTKINAKGMEPLQKWEALGAAVAEARALEDQEELDYGEPPDEFLDPLMYTLMEDPVILPKSRVTIDRPTIRSHLLSDPNDPFNRSPLKIEEVIPDTEMKDKIEAWKQERRAAALAAKSGGAAVEGDVGGSSERMDTSAD